MGNLTSRLSNPCTPRNNNRKQCPQEMSSQKRQEIQSLCENNLATVPIGEDEGPQQNGIDFYKYFFANYPQLRFHFKGAEHFTPEDVQKSERFKKQGQRILLAVHVVVSLYTNKMVFEGYIRETVNRHRQFKMDPSLWNAFWTVWIGYLASKGTVDEEQKKAWAELGEEFAGVARTHLKNSGLPH